MSNTIRIKRSVSTNTPSSLLQGELAFSEDGSPNSIGELFIGTAGPSVTKLLTQGSEPNQTITTGTGIDGADAGSSANITLSLAIDELAVATMVTGDWIAFDNAGTSNKALISAIPLGIFNNDVGWTTNVGTVTSVTASTGVTVAGTGADPTVALDYLGVDNFIDSATNLEATAIATADTIIYHDATDNDVKKGLVSDLPFDAAGTDNSTDVTLAGTPDYITISGQVITRNKIDLTSSADVQGNLAVARLNSGTSASASTFWRGDGAWATPAGSGDVSGSGTTVDNTIVRWNGTSGTSIQESSITISDTGENLAGVGTLNTHTIPGGTSTFIIQSDILDEDDMSTDSSTRPASQQSIKAYIDAASASSVTHKGGYDAGVDVPPLDGTLTEITGSIDTTASTGVVGVGTLFLTEVNTGDTITVGAETRIINTITDNLNLTVTVAFTDQANDTSPEKTAVITSGILLGDMYRVTDPGGFFGDVVENGDVLIADQDTPTTLAHWTVVQTNIDVIDGGSF